MNYICSVCGYIYEEAKEGTPFADLPDTWVCPLCRAPKSAFQPEVKKEEKKAAAAPVTLETDLQELSAGELSVLFSNLARGCEKQYQEKEAALFRQLADYFDRAVPAAEACGMQELADKIMTNLQEEYPALEAAAAQDRGALRAYTWGLKVTRMQQAIVSQYLQQGEDFLAHTNVWVCSVCGFIYIGDNPPALCPVCKVPDWKFEKIQGGAVK